MGFITNQQLASRLPTAPPADGGGYFIMKSSGGACAGDAGYYYLPFGDVSRYAYGIQALDDIE